MGRRGLLAAVVVVAVLVVLALKRADGPGRAPTRSPGDHASADEKTVPGEEERVGPVVTVRTVFGRVVDARDGQPLPGASVWVIPSRAGGTTDARGAFEIPGPHGTLVRCMVSVPGVGLALGPWLPFETGDRLDAGTLRVERRLRIAGRVVDPSGAPVSGAGIELAREGRTSEEWETLLAEFGMLDTEADGRFSFDGLDDGLFRITVMANDSESDEGTRRTIEHVRAGDEGVVVVLPFPQQTVRGTVSVLVTVPGGGLLPQGYLQTSAGHSWESVPIRRGRASVEVQTTGPFTISVVNARDENDAPLPYRPAFLSGVVPREEPYAIALQPGQAIEGLVTTTDGMPLQATVTVLPSRIEADFPRNHLYDYFKCDPDGRFRSSGLLPGEYLLQSSCTGYHGTRPSVAARAGATGVRIEMRRAGRILLRVVAPEGEALGGGGFTLLAPPGYVAGGTSAVSVARNSKASFFEVPFDGLQEGEVYRIRGSVAGRDVGRYAPFEIDAVAGDGKPVEVVVRPGRTLAGRVVREDGEPVVAALVRVPVPLPFGEDETAHGSTDLGQPYALTGHGGRFELFGVPEHAFWLTCTATGFAQAMPVSVGPTDREIEIVLMPGLEVSGRLVGDAPLDFCIDWTPAGLDGEAAAILRDGTTSGSDGFFAVRGIPKGMLRLDGWRPWADDDDRYVQAEEVEAGASDLRLRVLSGARIEGTVRDLDGRPVHMATILVEAPWGKRRATTDHEGRFVLNALPPGRHSVRVRTAYGPGEAVAVDAPGPPVHLTYR